VALHGGESGEVTGVRLVRNELHATAAGTLQARPTDRFEELPVGLVFRSVGYRGSTTLTRHCESNALVR
jgi:ferredoxin/flavodoxin---NADP+ reductase